jgi:DNA-binding MarR family transcriptional regulator
MAKEIMAPAVRKAGTGQGAPSVSATAGLGFYLREAYRAFSREFHARLACHGITHAQWSLLWFLSQAGSLTPLELSRQAGIRKASATSVVNALKKRRLIRGDRDRVDRRKINLHLTSTGVALMQELIACAAATNAEARGKFTDDELETLLRLLRGVTANLGNGAG